MLCEHQRALHKHRNYPPFVRRYGVFFGAGDPRNVSEALQGPVQTNNRAEMTAVLEALKVSMGE